MALEQGKAKELPATAKRGRKAGSRYDAYVDQIPANEYMTLSGPVDEVRKAVNGTAAAARKRNINVKTRMVHHEDNANATGYIWKQ